LNEQLQTTTMRLDWMLRLVDVKAALLARGYSEHVGCEVHLDVRDNVLEHNDGRIVLRVANGVPEVVEGGDGKVHIDVRALATVYTGHVSPAELAWTGAVSGDERQIAALAQIFAGPKPWMADMF